MGDSEGRQVGHLQRLPSMRNRYSASASVSPSVEDQGTEPCLREVCVQALWCRAEWVMTKKVFCLSGVSGCGKSTHAKAMINVLRGDGLIVSADDFFMQNDKFIFDRKRLGQAHGTCFRNYIEALRSSVSNVVVDNTNTT